MGDQYNDVLLDLQQYGIDTSLLDSDLLIAYIDAVLTNRQIVGQLKQLSKIMQQFQIGITFLAQQLQSGKLTPEMWESEMRKELKALHIIAGAMSRKDFDLLDFRAYGYIGSNLKKEYRYLRRLREQIEQKKINLNSNAFLHRAASYAINSRQSFYGVLRLPHPPVPNAKRPLRAYTQERRILHPTAQHCPDCLAEAAKHWQPLGTLRIIGDSQCKTNCKCRMEFR